MSESPIKMIPGIFKALIMIDHCSKSVECIYRNVHRALNGLFWWRNFGGHFLFSGIYTIKDTLDDYCLNFFFGFDYSFFDLSFFDFNFFLSSLGLSNNTVDCYSFNIFDLNWWFSNILGSCLRSYNLFILDFIVSIKYEWNSSFGAAGWLSYSFLFWLNFFFCHIWW